jgi:hypothetical protein
VIRAVTRIAALIVLACTLAAAPARAGGAREIGIGSALGTTFGVAAGGIALAFVPNPDRNYPYYLAIGGGVGLIGGVLFGVFVPEDEQSALLAELLYPAAAITFDAGGPRFHPLAVLPATTFAPGDPAPVLRIRLVAARF